MPVVEPFPMNHVRIFETRQLYRKVGIQTWQCVQMEATMGAGVASTPQEYT